MNWEENIRVVTPYTPGEQPSGNDILKLNTNENPYPPSPAVEAVLKSFDASKLKLYPDPDAGELVKALAERYRVGEDQVFVGVGSDDVLALSFLTFFNSGKPVLFPDVTYSFYDVWAELFRIPYKRAPLDDKFRLNKEDYKCENGGVIFANPNAPTGIFEELDIVEDIVVSNPGSVVIVDEAYVDFGGVSAIPLTERYDNLLVVQTFSKSRALAGLRIGYAIGSVKLIDALKDVKFSFNSYTMNRLATACGKACVEDEDWFVNTCAKVTATRERTKKALSGLGFTFPDSRANFIFASHPDRKAAELFEELKKEGIYVRYFNRPRIDNYLRITVGTDEEMDRLISFLTKHG